MLKRKQGRRSAEAAEKTKKQILTVATELFSEHGYSGVSLRHISDQAQISHSLIRHHFGSKEQIWLHICENLHEHITVFCNTVASSLPEPLPPNEKLYQFAIRVLAFNLLNPQPIKLAADIIHHEGEHFLELINNSRDLDKFLSEFVSEHNDQNPSTAITLNELKWYIISFAHSATSLAPYLASVWPEDHEQCQLHHWEMFNSLIASKLNIPSHRKLSPDSLSELTYRIII